MADPDTQERLMAAVHADDTEGFRKLVLEDRERLTIPTRWGSWLRYAANFGKFGVVKMLVEELDVDINEGRYESGPLYAAAANGHLNVVRYLLDKKATLDVSNPLCNPLFAAIYGGYIDVVKLLLDAGIDPDVRYSGELMDNMDALVFAREQGQKDIENLLLADRQRRGLPDSHATGRRKLDSTSLHAQIIEHMAQHFGPVNSLALTEVVPTTSVPVAIHVIPKSPDEDVMVLFTTGMSDKAQNVPEGQESYRYTELMIRLPKSWPLDRLDEERYGWPIRWLRDIAAYPHDQDTWLGGPFALISNGEPPEPLGAGTQMSCMLLLRETADVNPIRLKDGREILMYALTPVYKEERDLEKKGGMSALLERLQQKRVSKVLDPARPNAAL